MVEKKARIVRIYTEEKFKLNFILIEKWKVSLEFTEVSYLWQ